MIETEKLNNPNGCDSSTVGIIFFGLGFAVGCDAVTDIIFAIGMLLKVYS